ncbi:protein of unknown function [Nitrospira japonica]|uniref:Uncharacterized protein n=1 Tax=Nitrospira japonica TaxID=1325564 RepID=A0A1W1I2H8_9BACT|nr:protein of unknown function [Nitrospira japonica]
MQSGPALRNSWSSAGCLATLCHGQTASREPMTLWLERSDSFSRVADRLTGIVAWLSAGWMFLSACGDYLSIGGADSRLGGWPFTLPAEAFRESLRELLEWYSVTQDSNAVSRLHSLRPGYAREPKSTSSLSPVRSSAPCMLLRLVYGPKALAGHESLYGKVAMGVPSNPDVCVTQSQCGINAEDT